MATAAERGQQRQDRIRSTLNKDRKANIGSLLTPPPKDDGAGVTESASPSDDPGHDIGPWIESPSSTRCSRYRYDYANQQLQVAWKNNLHHYVTTYPDTSTEVYRRFARSASKGRFVNRVLNGGGYWPSGPEKSAPSNPARRQVQSRP